MVVWHLKQVGKVNKSDKWVPHELTEYQKDILNCHLLLLYTTTNHFSIWSWHAMKSRFYMTASNDQLSGWTKMKLQSTSHSQTCTKKKDHGHCLVVCCPSYPLQLSESWWNHYIWEVCSANRWDAWKTATPAAGTGQKNGPDLCHNNAQLCAAKPVLQRLSELASSAVFTWPLASQLPLQVSQQLFAGKTLPQPAGGRKCFPRVWWIPKHRFYTMGINQLISYWQKCVDCSGSCFA